MLDEHERLTGEGFHEHLRQLAPLGNREGSLERGKRGFSVPGQHMDPAELGERSRKLGARQVLLELGDGTVEARQRLVKTTLGDLDVGQCHSRARSPLRIASGGEKVDRTLEPLPCLDRPDRTHGQPARLEQQLGLDSRVVGQCRTLVVVPRALRRSRRARPLAPLHGRAFRGSDP